MSSDIHFFIVHDNSQQELRLPKNFVRENWEGLSNPILLKLQKPNSNIQCKVYWDKRGDDICLTEGWNTFANMPGLRHKYLCLFKHKGGSYFKAIVHDKSALEVDREVGNDDTEKPIALENHIHFFKVLMQSNFQEELVLPKSFVKKHWKEISNPILLKLPTNAQYKMYWIKQDDKVLLKEGWKEFREMYSLRLKYFLFFKYKGGSCFEVVICDLHSKLEIDYSSHLRHSDKEAIKDREVINISNESERDAGLSNCKRKKTNTGAPRKSGRKVGTNSKDKPEKKSLQDNQRNEALEKANAYHSKLKNPSFVRELSPSYVKNNFLHVPSCFSRDHLRGLEGTALIGVCGDMTWSVKIGFLTSSGDRAIMSCGWKSFCKKYELGADDVCVFERTGVTPLTFKVEIFRAKEREEPSRDHHLQGADQQNHDNPVRGGAQDVEERGNGGHGKRKIRNDGISMSVPESDELERSDRRSGKVRRNQEIIPKEKPVRYGESSKSIERAKAFQISLNNHNPSFIRKIKATYTGRNLLRIPIPFSRDHLRGSDEGLAIIRVPSDMIPWPVTWRFENCSGVERAVINGGWKSFSQKYDLKAGDVCVFERIAVIPLYFKVEIFRARREEPSSDHHFQERGVMERDNGQFRKRKRNDGTSRRISESDVLKKSGSSNMQVNQFKIEMKRSHLRQTMAYIPAKFMKKHKEFLGKEVNLQVGGMSAWPVKVIPHGSGAFFSKGWTAFMKGCKLEAGDVCLFEIVDGENIVFKVSIQCH